MKLELHHINKLLTAYRNGFVVAGQTGGSRASLNELREAGYLEDRTYQPDRRAKATTRYYLTDAGRACIEPIARKRKEQIERQDREIAAKEALESAAPEMLTELKRLLDLYGLQSTADVIAKAEGRPHSSGERGEP